MTAHLIHVRPKDTGIWIVHPDDLDAPLSEHATETDAERAAIARAAVEDCPVLVQDRYMRVHVVHPPARGSRDA
jgi:hypothetical protein